MATTLELTPAHAAEYEAVRAEVRERLMNGGRMIDSKPLSPKRLVGDKHRKLNQPAHATPRGVGALTPAAERFAAIVQAEHDPGSVLTVADAARTAGMPVGAARIYVAKLKAAKCWPYYGTIAEARQRSR